MARRGVQENPRSRFERIEVARDPEEEAARLDSVPHLETRLLDDPTRRILSTNDSPDVGFDVSVNPYRGCEHACAYCYARPTHEYLGFSAGLDFESKILVKRNAPALLRKALTAKSWKPQVIAMSGVTDPYQPVERTLRITRGCLEVLAEFRNPVAIITKNRMVKRDSDLLAQLAEHSAAAVNLSITSLDPGLQRVMEPRASSPSQRLKAVEALARAGVPVGVMVAPIIPGLNDHEIPAIVAAAAAAGATSAGHIVLRLPHGVSELFAAWLERHFPDRKNKVLNRVREVRGGQLNDWRFGSRMRGDGHYAEQVRGLFESALRRHGLDAPRPQLSTAAFRLPGGQQLGLW
jgi:DNA repair photolyase